MKTKEHTNSQKALQGLGIAMLIAILSVAVYAAHSEGNDGFETFLAWGFCLLGLQHFLVERFDSFWNPSYFTTRGRKPTR